MVENKIYPFIPAMVNNVETWLSFMAENGQMVTHRTGWHFYFKSGKPSKKEYVFYSSLDASKGLFFDFDSLKKENGSRNSYISKDEHHLIEIAKGTDTIDCARFKYIRDKYYRTHYFSLFLMGIFFLAVHIVTSIMMKQREVVLLAIPWTVVTVYSFISLLLISKAIIRKRRAE